MFQVQKPFVYPEEESFNFNFTLKFAHFQLQIAKEIIFRQWGKLCSAGLQMQLEILSRLE